MSFLRKTAKAVRSMGTPLSRHALGHSVAPAWEHFALLSGLEALETVVDVGANVGQFALVTRLSHPAATLHCFEPMKDAAEVLASVFSAQPKVHIHTCALGSKAGAAPLHVTAKADSSSLLEPTEQATVFPGTHMIGVEEVPVARLSDVLSPADITGPALLKLDVQGFEHEVLKGAGDLLARFDWIYCEASFQELYADQARAHQVIAWLAANRFDLAGVETDRLTRRNGRSVQADFLFSNRECATHAL